MFYVKNVPGWERVLRVIVGALLIGGVPWLGAGAVWAWLVGASGAGLALSGLIGFCPACAMVGRRLDKQG